MKKIFTLLALLVAVVTGAQAQESLLSYTMDNENYAAQTDLVAGNGTIYFGTDKRETTAVAACGYGWKSDGNPGSTSTKYVKLVPSRAFAAGDIITVKCYCTSNDKGGVYIYDSRDGTKLLASYDIPTKSKNLEMTYEYTIQQGDAIIGLEEIYLYRKTDESTFFTEFEVTSGVDPNAPNITAPNVEIKATESGVAATEEIEVTGANLDGSTSIHAYFSPAVDGLSVELASTAIENGSIQTTATIRYVATQNVDENTTTLIISDGTTTCEATVTYSAHVTAYQQQAISSATTWDFVDVTGTVQYGKEGQDPQEERLYANIPELGFKSTFNAKALTFEGEYAGRGGYAQNGTLRFKTLVPGTVEVTFSNTGGSNNNRYLQVNGTTGTVEAVGTAKNTEEFEVAKGTVEITGVPREGGGGGLHAPSRNIKGGFHRIGNGMGRGGYFPQTVDHGRENHIAQGCSEALHHIGHSHPEAGSQDLPVRAEALVPGRDFLMPVKSPQDCRAAIGVGDGGCGRGALHAPSQPPQSDGLSKEGPVAGGIDHHKIQNHIDQVHPQPYPHGRPGIPGAAQHHPQNDAGSPEEHGGIQNPKIGGCQIPDGGIHLHPYGNHPAEPLGDPRQKQSRGSGHHHRLGAGFLCPFPVSRPHSLGNQGQKAHSDGGYRAPDEPVDRAGGSHRGGRAGSQGPHHGRVDILHRRVQQLFQHGGPCQGQHRRKQRPGEDPVVRETLCHSSSPFGSYRT